MRECPACLGEGEMDFSDLDAVMERLSYVLRRPFTPLGVQECDSCGGTGELTEEQYRDFAAWATARCDQFFAAVDAGEIRL